MYFPSLKPPSTSFEPPSHATIALFKHFQALQTEKFSNKPIHFSLLFSSLLAEPPITTPTLSNSNPCSHSQIKHAINYLDISRVGKH
jgi:hypothetical protein